MSVQKGADPLKILRTIFEDSGLQIRNIYHSLAGQRMILLLDMEGSSSLRTGDIPDIIAKLETAFPGIFEETSKGYYHSCGQDEHCHAFREEVERGTSIPHLLEHVILYLLGGWNGRCSGLSGQRSVDLEKGLTDHYYVVTEYNDKIEAVAASELAFCLVSAWMDGRMLRLEANGLADSVHKRLAGMLQMATSQRKS
jgi:hypothetical protein